MAIQRRHGASSVGVDNPHQPSRAAAAALAALALLGLSGCGEGAGVAAGATVHVYVAAKLCPAAQEALGEAGGTGDVEVRALCLRPGTRGDTGDGRERIDLAVQGANARRATEDSTTVAFIEAKGKAAEFAQPIVEGAGIAFVEAADGAAAMERVLRAVEDVGTSGTLRTKVRDALE